VLVQNRRRLLFTETAQMLLLLTLFSTTSRSSNRVTAQNMVASNNFFPALYCFPNHNVMVLISSCFFFAKSDFGLEKPPSS